MSLKPYSLPHQEEIHGFVPLALSALCLVPWIGFVVLWSIGRGMSAGTSGSSLSLKQAGIGFLFSGIPVALLIVSFGKANRVWVKIFAVLLLLIFLPLAASMAISVAKMLL